MMTGIDTLVRSYPMNFFIMDHTGTTSFSGLKNGNLVLQSVNVKT